MKSFMSLISLITIFGILGSSLQARAYFDATIVSVGDGDTVVVQSLSKKITIRLACIDAPENAQAPMGDASTQYLKSLVPTGSTVHVRELENDKYGRKVAEFFRGTDSINLHMVKAGHAVVYRKYLDGCNQTRQQFLDAENSAKKARLGIWGQDCMTMPWDFRRGKNNCSLQGNSPKSGYISGTCKSLKAQGLGPFYKSQGDPNYTTARDRDGDGIACE